MSNAGDSFGANGRFLYLIVLVGLIVGLQIVAVGQREMTTPVREASGSNKTQLKPSDVSRLLLSGRRLSSAEAENLEKALVADPTDLATRVTLIAYYTTRRDGDFKLKKSEHVLWAIRNVPDSEVLHAVVFIRLLPPDEGFEEARQLWLKHLDTYKGNLVVLTNAADFFQLADKLVAEKLIKQGATADPENPRWPAQLAQLYSLQMSYATAEARRSLAASAYTQYELAYELTSNQIEKRRLFAPLATSAFEAGEVEKAKSWALQALSDAAAAKADWSTADSVHHAHITLGRIALLSENLVEAKQHLIAATQVKDSAVLGSFGPNMMLAKELLEKGERETVIQYFEQCATFWKTHGEKLQQWTAIVKNGKIPDFGGNLFY